MSLDLKNWKNNMKDDLYTLSLMTDQKLCELLARKGIESLKIQMQIELIKTEIDRRSGT